MSTMLAYLFGPLLLLGSGLYLIGYGQVNTGVFLAVFGSAWLAIRADRDGRRA